MIALSNMVVRKVRRAWLKITRSRQEIGRKNIIAREPYIQWVKERAQVGKLHFFFNPLAFPPMPEPESVSMEEVEELRAKPQSLELENL